MSFSPGQFGKVQIKFLDGHRAESLLNLLPVVVVITLLHKIDGGKEEEEVAWNILLQAMFWGPSRYPPHSWKTWPQLL